jgi:hypothetical protein
LLLLTLSENTLWLRVVVERHMTLPEVVVRGAI